MRPIWVKVLGNGKMVTIPPPLETIEHVASVIDEQPLLPEVEEEQP